MNVNLTPSAAAAALTILTLSLPAPALRSTDSRTSAVSSSLKFPF